jgi:hypothetical protein
MLITDACRETEGERPHIARCESGHDAGEVLVAAEKQDCRDSFNPIGARPLIAVHRLLLHASSGDGGGVAPLHGQEQCEAVCGRQFKAARSTTSADNARMPRVLVDTRAWRELIDADGVERVRLTAKRVGSSVLVAPGVVYEMLRTSDRDLRRRQIRVVTRQSWTRLMPEVFNECKDVRSVVSARRPEWLLAEPDLTAFYRLRADWAGGRGFWHRARRDPDREAGFVMALGGDRLERARQEAEQRRELMSHLNYDSVSLKDWRSRPPSWEPGWEGTEVDVWRVITATTWWALLVTNPSSPCLDWLAPFLDIRRIAGEQASWNHLWGHEVATEEVPRAWLRWAVGWLQGLRRVTPGTPGDNQIAVYAYEADVFVTTDNTFADIMTKVRSEAPTAVAASCRVPHGPDVVQAVIAALT